MPRLVQIEGGEAEGVSHPTSHIAEIPLAVDADLAVAYRAAERVAEVAVDHSTDESPRAAAGRCRVVSLTMHSQSDEIRFGS